jgi:hypothetical protein
MEGQPLAPLMQETLRRLRVAEQARKLQPALAGTLGPRPSSSSSSSSSSAASNRPVAPAFSSGGGGQSSMAPSLAAHVRSAVSSSAAAHQQHHQHHHHVMESDIHAASGGGLGDEDDDFSFAELVERFAEMKGVSFLPNDRRGRHQGKQIYAFGRVNVYMDGRCLYAEVAQSVRAEIWSQALPVGVPRCVFSFSFYF